MARIDQIPDVGSLRGGPESLANHTLFETSDMPATAVRATFSDQEDPTAVSEPNVAKVVPIEQLRRAAEARHYIRARRSL